MNVCVLAIFRTGNCLLLTLIRHSLDNTDSEKLLKSKRVAGVILEITNFLSNVLDVLTLE